MSFGYSITDFVLLVQLAHNTFRNCQNAGEEYAEIACEVKCLHSVLKTLRQEARRPDSRVLDENTSVASQLLVIVDGCKNILDKLDHIIARYSGLKTGSEASPSKKLWQRLRFGSKMEELGAIREKIITYTSTISILLDTMQLHATGRVEFKMEGGFADMTSQFEQMRREIFEMASHARAEESKGANMSSLSLSTYAGDDKVVWRDFRRELLKKGFRGQSLEKYKYSLQAYMLKLDQSGLLENSHASSPWPPEQAIKTSVTPWWEKRRYLETINSIVDVQLTEHLEPPMAPSSSSEMPTPSANKRADIYGSDVVEDNTDLEIPGDLVDKQKPNIVKDLEPDTILSATRSSTTGVTEFQTMVLSVQSKKFERSRVGKIEMPKGRPQRSFRDHENKRGKKNYTLRHIDDVDEFEPSETNTGEEDTLRNTDYQTFTTAKLQAESGAASRLKLDLNDYIGSDIHEWYLGPLGSKGSELRLLLLAGVQVIS